MKVICTHETYKGHRMDLTYGKAYEVIDQVLIKGGDIEERFYTQKEWREIQLLKLEI